MKKALLLVMLIPVTFAIGCSSTAEPSGYYPEDPRDYADAHADVHLLLPPLFIATEYIVSTLTQTPWRGRLTGMSGNDYALEFLEGVFYSIGLVPFVHDSFRWGYIQTIFCPDEADPVLEVFFNDGTYRELVFGHEFGTNVGRNGADLHLPIVRSAAHANYDTFYVGSTWHSQPHAIRPIDTLHFKTGRGLWGDIPLSIGLLRPVFNSIDWSDVSYIGFRMNYTHVDMQVYNVVGLLPGIDRTRAVVVGAHFDGVGFMGDVYVPSALDNASGTAAIIRVAQILAYMGDPATDVIFVAFNGEENGLLGSAAFADELIALGLYDEIYMLNIDCVGFAQDAPFALDFNAFGADNLLELNNALAARMSVWDMDVINAGPMSDHVSFSRRGIPAASIGQFSPELMHVIHSVYDTIDILDFGMIDEVAGFVAEFITLVGADFTFSIEFPHGLEPHANQSRFAAAYSPEAAAQQEAMRLFGEMGVSLAFDEVVVIEVDDILFTFSSVTDFSPPHVFSGFFPDIYIRTHLRDLTLRSVHVSTPLRPFGIGLIILSDISETGHDMPPAYYLPRGEVVQVEMTDIQAVALLYTNNYDPSIGLSVSISYFAENPPSPQSYEIRGIFDDNFHLTYQSGRLAIGFFQWGASYDDMMAWHEYLDVFGDLDYYLAFFR